MCHVSYLGIWWSTRPMIAVFRSADGSDLIPIKICDKLTGLQLDIFLYNDDKGIVTRGRVCRSGKTCEKTPFVVNRDVVFPLKQCKFGALELPCPQDPKSYLAEMYGDDFMHPKHW